MTAEPPSPRVVLVEPGIPANVGFVARVLANFGVDDWRLVGGCGWRGTEAERTGAPARETLERVRETTSLEEAAAGGTHLVGFTARAGRHRTPIDLTALRAAAAGWGPQARPVLLFGREDRGLEKAETDVCAVLVRIRTRGFASMNLSHAVAVALHEWFREAPGEPLPDGPAWADATAVRRLLDRAREELHRADYRDPDGELDATSRRLAARPIETRDLRVLERIVRHARWLREGRDD